jgi:oligoendopeptidase F
VTTTTFEPASDYVPADLNAADFAVIEPLYRGLIEREVTDSAAFEQWLHDRSELDAACSESAARLYIDMTCDTDDEAKAAAYRAYITDVAPKLSEIGFQVDTRQAELSGRIQLDPDRYAVLERDTNASVELFREENVPLQTKVAQLDQDYQTVIGAMSVEFDGQERTMPQMAKYQESTDRTVRERAWTSTAQRRGQDRDTIDGIYDEMIQLRDTMAKNAGFDTYVGYAWKAKGRFDYTTDHCRQFHDAVEQVVMPFCAELDEQRKAQLGLDTLRPWDISVDPKGRDPLVPFSGGADLVSRTQAVFKRLSPELAEMFATLGDGSGSSGISGGNLLDLDSRKGKAPGGYQYMQDRTRRPFIFMNAAGVHRDVETMVHEAGHAFHSMYCVQEPLLHYRHSPIEFAEVASMTMELLTMPYWDAYYPSQEDADRARRKQLQGSLSMLPWIMTIDAFQMWVYEHPTHTRAERAQAWLDLEQRFGMQGHRVDWSGIEDHRTHVWQRQGHLFGVPFYYIEYGIAQLGALGLWLKSLEDGEAAALTAYKTAMSLGGSKPLPELFAAAGLPFDFGAETVGRLVERVQTELTKLPE